MILPAGLAFGNFVVIAIVVAALYFSREILVPIALAVLLSFVLVPLVKQLQRWRFPRAMAVIVAVVMALGAAIALSTLVMVQVNQLGKDLPRYQSTLSEKVHSFRDMLGPSRLFGQASELLKGLGKELESPDRGAAVPPPLADGERSAKPIPVEVHQPAPGASETLVAVLQPLVSPLMTGLIVLIFVTFFLFQREDLRDRFIRLVGSKDLERTTAAMDDAARRLGKVFATQLILNALFGAIIGIGLALIGVPSASLWGLLAMILRFVPYVGAPLAAFFPLTLAAAVGPDWTMVLWTAALFAILEPVMGQLIEPFIYGQSAGLSPVAIVLSAAFWTWLWGPLGLLMSTPLTLCLVVMARHVDRLEFIDIMLGDRPALSPQQAAYQRMLTGDPIEAIEQARAFVKEKSVLDYYEQILAGSLRLAQADSDQGKLDESRIQNIIKTVSELVEDLGERSAAPDSRPEVRTSSQHRKAAPADVDVGKPVFCTPGTGRLDDCAVLVVADSLRREGINAQVASATTVMEKAEAPSICLCYIEKCSEARLEYAVRKLSRKVPAARIVVCQLSGTEVSEAHQATDRVRPFSIRETIAALTNPKGHIGPLSEPMVQ